MALKDARYPTVDPILFFPRVNQGIIEQLERQLFQSGEEGDGFKRSQPDAPARDVVHTDVGPIPTSQDLQAGLMLIVQAGVEMDELRRLPLEAEALQNMYEVVSLQQHRLSMQDQQINQLLDELRSVKAEVEAIHRRMQAAETKLRRFMSILAKIISPYTPCMIFGIEQPQNRDRGSGGEH